MDSISWATAARRVLTVVVAFGTVVCGVGLLDLVVRPEVIERVNTLALIGVAGLIVLPPLTLTLAWVERRRRRASARGRVAPAEPPAVEVQSKPIVVPAVASLGGSLPAIAVRTDAVETSNGSGGLANGVAPRRVAGGRLMSSVANELAVAACAEAVAARADLSRARSTQHDGHRRDFPRRRSGQDLSPLLRSMRDDSRDESSDSMLGLASTAG